MTISFCDIRTLSDKELKDAFFLMSEERQVKCRNLLDPNKKKQCIAADLLARKVTGSYLQKNSSEILILKTDDGKPYIAESDLHISLSHTNDLVCCALSEFPVGIDAEKIRPISQKAIKRICNEQETAYVFQENSALRFLELWTRKEALFKMGIRKKLNEIQGLQPEVYGAEIATKRRGDYIYSIAEKKR